MSDAIQSLLPSKRTGAYTALDIGPDAIVAIPYNAHGVPSGEAQRRPLLPGVLTDGEVTSADALAEELRALISEHGFPRDVRVGLAHSRLAVRTIEVPGHLDGDALAATVRHHSEGLLPMPPHEVVLDFKRIGAGASGQQRILIAAARAAGIERLMEALDLAHLRARQVQLCGLALLRALDAPPVNNEAVLYVQAGGLTNIVVTEEQEPVLVRVAASGSETVAAVLAERAKISHAEARARAAAAGVAETDDDQARDVVREELHRIVADVHSSLEFHTGREDARPVGAVVLTGSMTAWPGVTDALSDELGLPVVPAGRDAWPLVVSRSVPVEALDVAVGLGQAPKDVRPDLRPQALKRSAEAGHAPRTAQAICGVAAVLAALVVYFVIVSNQLTGAHDRTDRARADTATAVTQAAALKPYSVYEKATKARRQAVANVAKSRFDWARVMRQLAEVTPNSVSLTSMKGTLTPTTQIDGGADSGTAAIRGLQQNPALETAGCARREGLVPDYMDQLRGIGKATDVGFSRSERLGGTGATATPGSTGGADCAGNSHAAQFDLVTFFQPVGGTAAAPGAATTGAAAGTPPAAAAPANQTANAGSTP